MNELSQGLLGGRKFAYQLKLAINRGINVMNDPMLGQIVHALQLASYMAIKKKARILEPQSCTLIGIVDETGLLEENEVFVQIRRDSFSTKGRKYNHQTDDNRVVGSEDAQLDVANVLSDQQLLVTRNPCLNPGDLRLLNGVDRPEL